jgi:hypothetical protein
VLGCCRFPKVYLEEFPGYYSAGDAGFSDANGYLHIMARTDDVINVAGRSTFSRTTLANTLAQPSSAHTQPSSAHTQPSSDHTQPSSVHTQPSSVGHTQPSTHLHNRHHQHIRTSSWSSPSQNTLSFSSRSLSPAQPVCHIEHPHPFQHPQVTGCRQGGLRKLAWRTRSWWSVL